MSVRTMMFAGLVVLATLLSPQAAFAQTRSVTITIPAGVSFSVPDVSATVTGSPGTFRIVFPSSTVRSNEKLTISVKADTATFSGPGIAQIPVSKVSWSATAVGAGTGTPGTLSSSAYGQVFQSGANPKSGEVDLTWRLAPIAAAGLRAGTHSLTVRWRLESF